MKKILSVGINFLLACLVVSSLILPLTQVTAAPAVAINSPLPGQLIPGTDFTASGTSSPNTTIVLSSAGTAFAQTKSDGSGNWNVDATLPAGTVTMTAKAIENPQYGYFVSTPDLSSYALNQIRLSDRALNPNPGWPITTSSASLFFMPSPVGSIFYGVSPFQSGVIPSKFDASNPADPVQSTGAYPSSSLTNKGDFNSDGTKYYSANIGSSLVSVIDVSSNAWEKNIDIGSTNGIVTIWRSPTIESELYVPTDNKVYVVSTVSDTVSRTIDLPCQSTSGTPTIIFSPDPSFPYFYVPCVDEGKIAKMNIQTGSAAGLIDISSGGYGPSGGSLSLDSKRMYTFGLFGSSSADKVKVVDTQTDQEIQTIQLTDGALGFLSSPDFQNIFISTPGNGLATNNIDVLNTSTNTITQVPTSAIAGTVTASPSQVSTADVDVSFVLGAQSASAPAGELAKTGLFIALATPIGLFLILGALYTYYDYQKHKMPLLEVAPDQVDYSYWHHLRVVSVPLAKYRFSVSLQEKKIGKASKIRRL